MIYKREVLCMVLDGVCVCVCGGVWGCVHMDISMYF